MFQIEAASVLQDLVELVPVQIEYIGNPTLIQFEVINCTIKNHVNGSGIIVGIQLQRMFIFHLANTFFPTICLIIIVEITLFIDDSNFDTNVMVALTTLLVMYTLFQSISSTLPKTAYLKLIDYWLLFSLILPFVIFMFHMVQEVKKAKHNMKMKVRPTWVGSGTQPIVRKNDQQKSKAYVQFFIPLLTALFIVAYWIYAMHVYNK